MQCTKWRYYGAVEQFLWTKREQDRSWRDHFGDKYLHTPGRERDLETVRDSRHIPLKIALQSKGALAPPAL